MRYLVTFALITAGCFFASCKKETLNNIDIKPGMTGKWNVITDSTFSGVGLNNHPVNITGQAGDYFDFRTDGNLYIKEDITLETLSYTLTSDTTIVIDSFGGITLNGVPGTCFITDLMAHTVTITAPFLATPGGVFGRKVQLNR